MSKRNWAGVALALGAGVVAWTAPAGELTTPVAPAIPARVSACACPASAEPARPSDEVIECLDLAALTPCLPSPIDFDEHPGAPGVMPRLPEATDLSPAVEVLSVAPRRLNAPVAALPVSRPSRPVVQAHWDEPAEPPLLAPLPAKRPDTMEARPGDTRPAAPAPY